MSMNPLIYIPTTCIIEKRKKYNECCIFVEGWPKNYYTKTRYCQIVFLLCNTVLFRWIVQNTSGLRNKKNHNNIL